MVEAKTATKEVEQRQEVTSCNRIQEDTISSAETVEVTKVQEGIENPMEQMGEPRKGPDLLVEEPLEDQISIQTARQHWTDGEP